MDFKSNTPNQMYHVKGWKECARKWCEKLSTLEFTFATWKIWLISCHLWKVFKIYLPRKSKEQGQMKIWQSRNLSHLSRSRIFLRRGKGKVQCSGHSLVFDKTSNFYLIQSEIFRHKLTAVLSTLWKRSKVRWMRPFWKIFTMTL